MTCVYQIHDRWLVMWRGITYGQRFHSREAALAYLGNLHARVPTTFNHNNREHRRKQ
jgi:hypothetical protein